jgi:hypothetical protein
MRSSSAEPLKRLIGRYRPKRLCLRHMIPRYLIGCQISPLSLCRADLQLKATTAWGVLISEAAKFAPRAIHRFWSGESSCLDDCSDGVCSDKNATASVPLDQCDQETSTDAPRPYLFRATRLGNFSRCILPVDKLLQQIHKFGRFTSLRLFLHPSTREHHPRWPKISSRSQSSSSSSVSTISHNV